MYGKRDCVNSVGRTSEINSLKSKYAQEEKRFLFVFGEFVDLFFAVILGRRYERGLGDLLWTIVF